MLRLAQLALLPLPGGKRNGEGLVLTGVQELTDDSRAWGRRELVHRGAVVLIHGRLVATHRVKQVARPLLPLLAAAEEVEPCSNQRRELTAWIVLGDASAQGFSSEQGIGQASV